MRAATTVGSRELKARLGTHLRKVKEGRTLIVTERGRPVAELKPLPTVADPGERRLEEMAARGLISRGGRGAYQKLRLIRLKGGALLSDAILADRANRI